MKFLKSVKDACKSVFLKPVIPLTEQDVELLALLCVYCRAKIVKNGLIKTCYSYYVPQNNKDIDVIRQIFVKNGIDMKKHFSHILDKSGQDVLRMDYTFNPNKDAIKREIKRIERKHFELYSFSTREEKAKILQRFAELKQNQK